MILINIIYGPLKKERLDNDNFKEEDIVGCLIVHSVGTLIEKWKNGEIIFVQ